MPINCNIVLSCWLTYWLNGKSTTRIPIAPHSIMNSINIVSPSGRSDAIITNILIIIYRLMNLIRLIVIALIVYLLIRAFKRYQENKISQKSRDAEKIQQQMVPCEVCKLHIPEQDALIRNGKYYCCQEHLEQDNH